MIFTKIMIVPIVALIILAGFLSTDPTISGFFESLKDKFYSATKLEPNVARNIDFSGVFHDYNAEIFDASSPINITVDGITNITLEKNYINTPQNVSIINYRGHGSVSNVFSLDGTYEKMEFQDISFSGGKINLQSNFSLLYIDNMRLKTLNFSQVDGTISLNKTSIEFSGSIEIKEPRGHFVFKKYPNSLNITGTSQRIFIPSVGINVG